MKKRLKELDGLRGIFALLVVCYHFSASPQFDPLSYTTNFIFRHSFIFVDFFFVLSGFVIAFNYSESLNSDRSFWDFVKKRFVRLYPLLIYSVLVYVPLKAYGILTGFEFNDGVYSFNNLILETLDPLVFMNSTPLLGSTEGMNPVSWSISAEMISYLFFGLMVLLLRKNHILVISSMAVLAFAFFFKYGSLEVSGSLGFLRGILGFSLGVVVYSFYERFSFQSDRLEIPYLVVLIGLFYLVDLNLATEAILVFPLWFSLGVLIFSKSNGFVSWFLRSQITQFIGKISYSIYLNHFFVLWVVYFFVWQILKLEVSEHTIVVCFVLTLGITILYSFFTHKYIEVNLGSWLKSKILKKH